MPQNLDELAAMIAHRDNISFEEALRAVDMAKEDIDYALFSKQAPELVEEILQVELGLELDYFDLFI